MTNFIEEFYYGNIDPQARSFEQNEKVKHDMQTLTGKANFHKFSLLITLQCENCEYNIV